MSPRSTARAPLSWKLVSVALVFLAITGVAAAMAVAAIGIQSAVRSYVAAEGQWSEAQRDAVHLLRRYAQSAEPEIHDRFERSMAIPFGALTAREALSRPVPDRSAIERGFLAGGSHPDDIGWMIAIYRCCHWLPSARAIIARWVDQDRYLIQLQSVAQRLREQTARNEISNDEIEYLLKRVDEIGAALAAIDNEVAEALGGASRNSSSLLMIVMISTILTLIVIGMLLIVRVLKGIRSSEHQYRTLLDGASDGLIVFGPDDGLMLEVSQSTVRMTGRPMTALIGAPYLRLFDRSESVDMPTGEAGSARLATLRGPRGQPIPVEVNCSETEWGGRPARLAIIRDIGERLKTEQQLRIATNAMANLSEAVVITDERFRIVTINRAFTAITGFVESETLGKTPRYIRFSRHSMVRRRDILQSLHREGQWQGELESVRHNGESFPQFLSVSCVRESNGRVRHYVGIFKDNSASRDYEQRLRHLASHDRLTDLPNRTAFEERGTMALRAARATGGRLALLFIDLDGFKAINDTYGHAAGDRVLRVIGDRIFRALRTRDIVARVGGDEFNVLLDDVTSEADVTRLARTLLGLVAEPIEYQGQKLSLSSSIGISFYPRDAADVDELVTHADMAMYEAKNRGRNNYRVFSSQISIAAKTRLTLVNGLRQAIDLDQLELHYQPHTDLLSGRVLGLEALLRWNHPELGSVPPAHFIPIAEEIGVIDALSDWVLRSACTQGAAWRARGLVGVGIAVNLSPRNFWDRELPQRVDSVLKQTGWPAELLCLEITESTIMGRDDPEVLLRRLRDLGVRLAVDDFGVGYSSLGNLRRFPVDVLKIDRSFTAGIPDDADNLALVRTILALARGLGLTVVAEGIESRMQHDTLIAEGCLQGQGYLYGRPMPAAAIEREFFGTAERIESDLIVRDPLRPLLDDRGQSGAAQRRASAAHPGAPS